MIVPLGAQLAVLGVLPLDVDSDDPAFNAVKPGWIPFLIVIAMGVVLAFLFFSMRKQLRKVDFPDEAPKDSQER